MVGGLKNLSDESFCFCLSSATWACIWWPVIVVDTPEANHCGALGDACYVLDAEGQADFMFIEQPEMWMVVETQPVCIEWQGGLHRPCGAQLAENFSYTANAAWI